MKRLLAFILAVGMLLSFASCGENEGTHDKYTFAVLSSYNDYANLVEDLNNSYAEKPYDTEFLMYDNLNSALMDLNNGKVYALTIGSTTGKYIAAHNSNFVCFEEKYAYEIDYSMMTMDTNKDVYDILNNAIKEMKTDSTLDKLVEYELKAYINSDPEPKDLPHFEGARTIKIGVTGDLPPMDFVAANGKAAGFNIALITEIANRAQINFELVQVDSGARAMALSTGKVDAIFWTGTYISPDDDAYAEKIEGTLTTETYLSSVLGIVMPKIEN